MSKYNVEGNSLKALREYLDSEFGTDHTVSIIVSQETIIVQGLAHINDTQLDECLHCGFDKYSIVCGSTQGQITIYFK